MIWRDRHGSVGEEFAEVRLLKDVTALAHVYVEREEEVLVPTGCLGTVLYVNEERRLIGLEFHEGVEGNVFGNVSWNDVEILSEEMNAQDR